MANRFWNFVTSLVPGTVARAEDVNTNYQGIQAGNDAIEVELDRSIQITNVPGTTQISLNAAARANLILAFDASGDVTAQANIGNYRGDHAGSTLYYVRDVVRDAAGGIGLNNIYICNVEHTSSASIATDSANWDLVINVADVEAAKVAAAASEAAAGVSETNAGASAAAALVSEDNAEDWATLISGIVEATDYSSKAWAIGGVGVTDTAARGAAKEWASNAFNDLVDTSEYSAKHYSVVAANSAASVVGKQTIWIPAQAMTPTVSNGAAFPQGVETTAGNPDMIVMDFDPALDENAQFQIAFPKQWNEGTVTAQFFWSGTTVNTGNVIWNIAGVAVSDNGLIDAAYGTAVAVTDAFSGTLEDLMVSAESGAITISGTPAEGDVCFFKVTRDADNVSDTYTGDARLFGIKLHFTNNTGNDA